jgi:scyllo-inositol 2-dehydrogenase (NAD+)
MGKRHAENVRYHVPDAELVAVADSDAQRARQVATELGIAQYYDSPEELAANKNVQAVVIASPAKFHPGHIQVCAEAGKDILSEKPLAMTLAEADAALAAVARKGVRFQIGHMRRYDPAYADARKRIEAGDIGDPIIFKAIGRDPEAPPLSYYQGGLNGSLFLDSSIHEFDLARWLMRDEVAEVQTFGTVLGAPELLQFNDVAAGVVNLRFEHGAIGNVESFREAIYGYDIRTEIIGTRGTLMVGYLRQTRELVLTRNGVTHDVVDHYLVRFADAYVNEIKDFVRMIQKGTAPFVTGEDGRNALAIALAALRSYRESKPIGLSGSISAKVKA